jgi:soluble lytic murein transglycosylase-like protein
LYDVIHQEVGYFNRSEKESDWIARAILYASSEYQVDPILITAVMEAESGFDFQSLSSVGAIGLMQLMPETANAIGVNPYNPLENILGGTMYLKTQLDRFADYGKYAVTDAVAAYNAGAQAVINAGGVPNYSETRQYVVNVANNYQKLLEMMNEAEAIRKRNSVGEVDF